MLRHLATYPVWALFPELRRPLQRQLHVGADDHRTAFDTTAINCKSHEYEATYCHTLTLLDGFGRGC